MKFQLSRLYPQKVEIEVLPSQIVSMFPIEVQEHPTFGLVKRVWKSEGVEYSVDSFPGDRVENLSSTKLFLKVREDVMMELLQTLEHFEIVLSYQDKEDKYRVYRV